MTGKIYDFKFQNIKAMRYMGLMFLGIPFIFLLGYDVSQWVFMLVIFAPMVLGLGLFIWKMKARDVISMTDTYFDSSYFGKISYSEIVLISSPALYSKPCVRLKLNDGRKITWALSYRDNMFHGQKDLDTFQSFTEELEQQIKKIEDKSLSLKPAKLPLEAKPSGTNAAPEYPNTPSLTDQLEQVKKNNNSAKWTIPIGFAFAVLALVRTCGSDWFKPKDFNGPELTKSSEKLFERTSAEAKIVLEKLVRKSGPYFLYSNDTSANLSLLPDLDMENPTGISAFKYVTANKSLRAFIDHPDSAKLDLYVTGKGNNMGKMSKSILNSSDSAKTYLYFRAYDPTLLIPTSPQTTTGGKDSVISKVFDVTTGIPLYDTLSLSKAISGTFPGMNMMLANAKLRPSTYKLYLAARTGAGMNKGLFRKAVHELNKQMNAVHVDTATFKLKVFNEDPSRQ